MKFFFVIFLFSYFLSSQNPAFVYLDLSKITRYISVAEQVDFIMNSHTDVIVYISNGNNPEYFKKEDFSYDSFLSLMEGAGGYYSPDLNELTDSENINNHFSNNGLLNGLDDFFSNNRFTFYFIFPGEHLTRRFSRSPNEMIIKPFLLSNKLLKRDGNLIKNCKVILLYDDKDNSLKANIKSKINENYEFKNF